MRGKELMLGGLYPMRQPCFAVYDSPAYGARRLTWRDKKALMTAYEVCMTAGENTIVLATPIHGVIALGDKCNSAPQAIGCAEDMADGFYRRTQGAIGAVVAVTKFFPTSIEAQLIASTGALVLLPLVRLRRDTEGSEQRLKDTWLGMLERRQKRTLLLPKESLI